MCGGGNSLGSAQPTSQQSSHRPANSPIDRIVQPIRASIPSPVIVASRRATAAGRDVPAADPSEKAGGATTAMSGRRLVLELAVEVGILLDDLFEQRPVDRVGA